jgi:RNA polymerase sigma-70 factor (ECF subfamily)
MADAALSTNSFGGTRSPVVRQDRQDRMTEASDEDLMASAARGNEAAFRLLTARHTAPSIRLAQRLTGNAADAEDVAQEALLRVWTQAPVWRPDARFKTWLYRVVVNLAIDRRRQKTHLNLDAVADPIDPAPSAPQLIEQERTAIRVRAAIAALPARQRSALVLTHYEGLSQADAALVIGTSVGGLESLLVRAKRRLKVSLSSLIEEVER